MKREAAGCLRRLRARTGLRLPPLNKVAFLTVSMAMESSHLGTNNLAQALDKERSSPLLLREAESSDVGTANHTSRLSDTDASYYHHDISRELQICGTPA